MDENFEKYLLLNLFSKTNHAHPLDLEKDYAVNFEKYLNAKIEEQPLQSETEELTAPEYKWIEIGDYVKNILNHVGHINQQCNHLWTFSIIEVKEVLETYFKILPSTSNRILIYKKENIDLLKTSNDYRIFLNTFKLRKDENKILKNIEKKIPITDCLINYINCTRYLEGLREGGVDTNYRTWIRDWRFMQWYAFTTWVKGASVYMSTEYPPNNSKYKYVQWVWGVDIFPVGDKNFNQSYHYYTPGPIANVTRLPYKNIFL